jgi:hypothetical protein
MTHRVEDAVMSSNTMLFSLDELLPKRERVACQATVHLEGGAIARQTMLVVWDA